MASGAMSGFLSKLAVYPFDLVRKRLQMEGSYRAESNKLRDSWLSCMMSIMKQEGVRSLYKGLAPSLLKVAPANAVTFMVFEETKDLLILFKKND